MKRIMFSIMALFAISAGVMAQNSLSVSNIQLPKTDVATLTVNFQFDKADTYTGYQFDLELPEQLEFVLDENSTVPKYEMGECHDDHTLSTNMKDGVLTILASSMTTSPLKATSGILLKFTIKAASNDLVIGTIYECSIKNIKITDGNGAKTELDASTFNVTISKYTILDETSTVAPTAKTGVDVLVKRTIKANEWSTICLPFAMTEAQVKEAFGDDVKLGDFTGYDVKDEGETITVNFTDVTPTTIEGKHPYIIKLSAPVTEFTVDGVDIDPQDAEINKGTSRKPKAFIGNYVAGTEVENGCLFLNNNKFWYSVGTTKIKAFRAYFNFFDLLPDFEENYAEAPAITFGFNNGGVTGIESISNGMSTNDSYYNLNGQRVETPRKGLYILNNKKVVVK